MSVDEASRAESPGLALTHTVINSAARIIAGKKPGRGGMARRSSKKKSVKTISVAPSVSIGSHGRGPGVLPGLAQANSVPKPSFVCLLVLGKSRASKSQRMAGTGYFGTAPPTRH